MLQNLIGTFVGTFFATAKIQLGGDVTLSWGKGVPTAKEPNGSLYLRTDGASGSRLYVSAGAGTWTAVAGV